MAKQSIAAALSDLFETGTNFQLSGTEMYLLLNNGGHINEK